MKRIRLSLTILFLLFAFALPLLISDHYFMHVLVIVTLNIFIALSLFIIVRTGQLSIGHAAFMAVGGYSSALMVLKLGVSPWLSLPIAGFIVAGFAALVGYPCLRIRGFYFVLITFAINEIVRLLILNLDDLTGGADGLQRIPRFSDIDIFGISAIHFSSLAANYYLILFLSVVAYSFVVRLWRSRIGRICEGIETNDRLSASLGINIMRYKMVIFVIGCFLVGVAGSFFAHYQRFLSPADFTIWNSIYMLMYIQVGGIGSIQGAIVGAILITILIEVFRFALSYQPLIFGCLLILVMLWLPEGVVTFISKAIEKRGRLTAQGGGASLNGVQRNH